MQSPIYPLVHAKHFHRVPTSTVIIVVAETVTSAVTNFSHHRCCSTLSAQNENMHRQVSRSLLLSRSKGRVLSRRSQGLFTGWFYFEDNSNEVFLQGHSFSDDDPNDDVLANGHGQEFILTMTMLNMMSIIMMVMMMMMTIMMMKMMMMIIIMMMMMMTMMMMTLTR